ncbi:MULTISPECIES: arsenate reductase family protein [Reichenbachiella]|uniref:Uncharacterized protein n=1 Tax=Reichenbachiella agariperforans TaxID=156994 RepID=A0A1M6LM35_REIAG|nr:MULTISPECIES: hypothetical protein [Reichenbachiella]MBU2913979.1 hypothetical protein [Reichenbachiella agariperforans]RJE74112.1 hypothetical protein BGP76_13020 [Reichenbachiella sp. MSK19-1]SHJ72279.1 hypothetical protein SAMN04488028_1011019 [Reichenbachiella agariperforans]
MTAQENELLLIFNSKKQEDKELRGYAAALNNYKLNEKDLSKDSITATQIAEIAQVMRVKVSELVDTSAEQYQNKMKNGSYSDDDLVHAMENHQDLIKTPIAFFGTKVFFVQSKFSFHNEGLDVRGIHLKDKA